MSLVLKKNENETWLQAALRYASKYGMEKDIQKYYDMYIKQGESEADAAYGACEEWDILDYVED